MITAKKAREITDKFYSVQEEVESILSRVEDAARKGHDEMWMEVHLARGSGREHMLEPVKHALQSLGFAVSYRRDGKVIDLKW